MAVFDSLDTDCPFCGAHFMQNDCYCDQTEVEEYKRKLREAAKNAKPVNLDDFFGKKKEVHVRRKPVAIFDSKSFKAIRILGSLVFLGVLAVCLFATTIAETKADAVGIIFVATGAMIWLKFINTRPPKRKRKKGSEIDCSWKAAFKEEGGNYVYGLFALIIIILIVEMASRLKIYFNL